MTGERLYDQEHDDAFYNGIAESKLVDLEDEITVLAIGTAVSDMEVARRLALVEDQELHKARGFPTFAAYLRSLAKHMWADHQIKTSESNYLRLLSHFRLFVQTLGFSSKDCLMMGMGNMDIMRTMIDWRFSSREIGPGEAGGKMNEDDARKFVGDTVAQAYQQGGAVPVSIIKAAQEQLLGRTPITVKLVARVLDADRVKITAIELWEGGIVCRAMESLPKDKFHWLAKRLRASTEEVVF